MKHFNFCLNKQMRIYFCQRREVEVSVCAVKPEC